LSRDCTEPLGGACDEDSFVMHLEPSGFRRSELRERRDLGELPTELSGVVDCLSVQAEATASKCSILSDLN